MQDDDDWLEMASQDPRDGLVSEDTGQEAVEVTADDEGTLSPREEVIEVVTRVSNSLILTESESPDQVYPSETHGDVLIEFNDENVILPSTPAGSSTPNTGGPVHNFMDEEMEPVSGAAAMAHSRPEREALLA